MRSDVHTPLPHSRRESHCPKRLKIFVNLILGADFQSIEKV